ncbi:MAG: hypothetical protein ACREFY_16400 [Acetobacteraceae bacterium]
MLGLFWVVEDRGRAVLITHAVSVEQAVPYGDMLTVDTGHLEFWSELARRGPRLLRAAGIPTTPVWSEYEEWPRGRVLYDRSARCFVIRADRQLHQPALLSLITNHFRIAGADTRLLPDDHYRSIRRVPLPPPRDTATA